LIEAKNLSMKYDDFFALKNVNAQVKNGSIFGLVGTNGAGKSTFLKLCAGILRPNEGSIEIDSKSVFENTEVKSEVFYISDDQYYPSTYTPTELMKELSLFYTKLNNEKFTELANKFELPLKRKINTYSKGMRKLLFMLLGICAQTEYLLCDETFDGLDPVVRQAVKSLLAAETQDRSLTPVIASHNLRELEDICDHVGLLYKGGILFSKDLNDLKLNIHRIQLVPQKGKTKEDILKIADVANISQRGSLFTITVRGEKEEIERQIKQLDPIFYEIIDLTLEEIFISETEVLGYDIKKLVL